MDNTEILEGLGFNHEMKGDDWTRWRHELAEDYNRDFALIIWDSYSTEEVLAEASRMLRKIGQQQKMDQITNFID